MKDEDAGLAERIQFVVERERDIVAHDLNGVVAGDLPTGRGKRSGQPIPHSILRGN
ncbi:hypothetical protein ACFYU5_19240 [Nocardia aobensis]|uniref:Transposase n=1 Tax=Nocardia aobensis TaxID=257277 RepID=A0ABW6P5W5_9NOCA